MSTWKYQVVKHDDFYAIHEVFYDADGRFESMEDFEIVTGETIEELRAEITKMFESTVKEDIIDPKGRKVDEVAPALQTRS